MTDGKTIYIVDDDPACVSSMSALLSSSGYEVKGYTSVREFKAHFDPGLESCLVLDIRLAHNNGLELQQELLTEHICPPIVVLTGYPEKNNVVRAVTQGAAAFLTKPCSEVQLQTAIEGAFAKGSGSSNNKPDHSTRSPGFAKLTPVEMDVLALLLAGKPNKTMAKLLNISQRAVEERRARIMRKLGLESVPELVRLATEAGIEPKH